MSRPGRVLAWIAGGVLALALGLVAFAWLTLRASLPQLDGEAPLAGLTAPVAVERDAAGVPVIRGATRADVARATGYVHAQGLLVPVAGRIKLVKEGDEPDHFLLEVAA